MTFEQVAVVLVLFGTSTQAWLRIDAYWTNEEHLAEHFSVVRDLMEEVRWRRPVRRVRRRREVMDLLRNHPAELQSYRRVYWELVVWVVFLTSAVLGACAAFGLGG